MPDPAGFIFDRGMRRFRDGRGKFVKPEVVRAGIDAMAAGAGAEMRAVSEKLQAGEINASEWEIRMRGVVKAAHVAAGTIALGGKAGLDARGMAQIANAVKAQYNYLRSFGREISAGLPLDGNFIARSAMYGQAARSTYENIGRARDIEAGYDEERRVIHGKAPCRGCMREAAKGWRPAGELIKIGQCECLVSCHCSFIRRKSAPPTANPSTPPMSSGGSLPPLKFALSPQQSARRSVLVMADVAKLDASLASDPGGFYVGKGGKGPSAIKGRYANARAFLESAGDDGTIIHPSDVSLGPDGQAYIDDGRHRFAVLRDAGVKAVPVAVWSGQAKVFRKLYGAKGVIGMGDDSHRPDDSWSPSVSFGRGGAKGGAKSAKAGKAKGAAKLHGAGNCGTGKGGFRPGNTCGKSGRQKLAENLRAARSRASSPDDVRSVRLVARELRHHRRGKEGAVDKDTARVHSEALRAGKTPAPKHVPERKPTRPSDAAHESPGAPGPWKPRPEHEFPPAEGTDFRGHKEWAGGLSDGESRAIRDYAHGGFQDTNEFARDPRKFAAGFGRTPEHVAREREKVATLDAALSGAQAPRDMTVYRGMRKDALRSMGLKLSDLREGAVFETRGFTSTSTSKKTARRFARDEVVMTIRVPRGTPGGYLNATGLTMHPEETEFLMPTHVNRYRVVRTINRGQGEREIVVEVDRGGRETPINGGR